MNKLDWALWALDNTPFYVFPLRPNTKKPLLKGAGYDATRDTAAVNAWWAANPDANIGYAYFKSGHSIVDLDVKDANPGLNNWREQCFEHGDVVTLTWKTTSGGYHLVFDDPEGYVPTKSSVWPGVDTRGPGGYGVGLGSTIEGGAYEIAVNAPIAPLPDWLRAHFGKTHAERQEMNRKAAGEFRADTPIIIATARAYLADKHAAEGKWGQEDPPDTFAIGARMHDFGVSEAGAVELLMECLPAHERPWLTGCVRNSYEYAKNEFGCDRPKSFSEEAGPIGDSANPYDGRPLHESENLPDITFYDDLKMLPNYSTGGVGMVWGFSSTYKTAIVLTWCYQLAAKGIRTAYVCGERREDVGARSAAIRRVNGWEKTDLIREFPMPNVWEVMPMEMLTAGLKKHAPQVIFIDTMAAFSAGWKDYNQVSDLFTIHGHIGKLAATTRALVLAVAHAGWDKKHEAGAAAQRHNSDVSIEFEANTDVAAGEHPTHIKVHAMKVKGGRAGHKAYYSVEHDTVKNVPVPVECTETEWLYFKSDGKKPAEAITLEGIRGNLCNMGALDESTAVNTITLVRRMFSAAEDKIGVERFHKMTERLAKMVERRRDEFAACSEFHEGSLRWYHRTASQQSTSQTDTTSAG